MPIKPLIDLIHKSERTFVVVGVSFEKAHLGVREKFTITPERHSMFYEAAISNGVDHCVLLSTCNRTEVYAWSDNPTEITNLFLQTTQAENWAFQDFGYVMADTEAINHFYCVGAGLKSQIIGDFEIIGQIKKSYAESLEFLYRNSALDRLFNTCIQISKRIKKETSLSSGATSVAFASIQVALQKIQKRRGLKVGLVGTGKLGRNTVNNLSKQAEISEVTLFNRHEENARELASRYSFQSAPISDLKKLLPSFDLLFVATAAQKPTVAREMLLDVNQKLLIMDLAMPRNVDATISELQNVEVIDLDHISKIANEAIQKRLSDRNKAKSIVEEGLEEWREWVMSRSMVPIMRQLNSRLEEIKEMELKRLPLEARKTAKDQEVLVDGILKKLSSYVAQYLRNSKNPLENDMQFLEDLFQISKT